MPGVMFWSDDEAINRSRDTVAMYVGPEAAKFTQKQPPRDFDGVGNYYGVMGRRVGFVPVTEEVFLPPRVDVEVQRRLRRFARVQAIARGREHGYTPNLEWMDKTFYGDGFTAFGLGAGDAARIIRWSEAAAERKRQRDCRTWAEWHGDERGAGEWRAVGGS